MALTNQQVQQVFLAITGRPAEGSAVAWGANSLSVAALANAVVDIRKGADFTNSKEAFVENLYEQLLGRPSDAEGKEFWLNALNNGASYGDVLSQFVNAVLAQPSSADIYTLQNKLSIAEKISAQVNTFQGGAAAEADLKDLMSGVDTNTTFESLDDSIKALNGQYVNIANVTVKVDAEEATEGSDEHATIFNATINLATSENGIDIQDAADFADTLNLSVKGVKDDAEIVSSNEIGTVSGVANINLNFDSKIKESDLSASDFASVKVLNYTGKTKDKLNIDAKMTSVDTGAADDEVTVGAKVDTLKTGAGNDTIKVGIEDVAMNIDAGTGTQDRIIFSGDQTKLTLSGVEFVETTAATTMTAAQLSGKKYALNTDTGNEITVNMAKVTTKVDLSKLSAEEGGSGAAIKLDNVKAGANITLGAANETITVDANIAVGKKITLAGFESVKDDLVLTAAKTKLGLAGGWNTNVSELGNGKVSFVSITGKATQEKILEAVSADNLSATNTAVIFVDNGSDTVAYNVSNTTAGGTVIDLKNPIITLAGLTDIANTDITLA